MSVEFELPENSLLYADDCRGIYIPQYFAQSIKRDLVTGIEEEDYKILEAGPDHELYWDVWDGILQEAVIKHPTWGDCYFYQDGCLWIIAKEQPEKEDEEEVEE